jgi:chorismate-pyruvate lyase
MSPSTAGGPDLRTLYGLFDPAGSLPQHVLVPENQVPSPYHELLVHEHHMTVTVEAHHGSLVDVRILDRRHEGDSYARKILLTLQSTGRVVQFGIVRIWLPYCSEAVRSQIIEGKTPLGRILIEHDVLRRIEPTAFLRIVPDQAMMGWFGLDRPTPTYGRLAIIHCDGQPAIELLEVVAPE